MFAIISNAKYFIGVDSGPMHTAAAFKVDSLILIQSDHPGSLSDAMGLRHEVPYFHPRVRKFANLYADHSLVEVNSSKFIKSVPDWIKSRS